MPSASATAAGQPPQVRVLVAARGAALRDRLRQVCESDSAIDLVGDAGDGSSAVELAQAVVPDIVLAEVTLPLPDGAAITPALLAAEPRARIIVLGLPRHQTRVLEALRLGARGHLLVGDEAATIVAAVHAVHRGEARLDSGLTARLLDELRRGALSAGPLQLDAPSA